MCTPGSGIVSIHIYHMTKCEPHIRTAYDPLHKPEMNMKCYIPSLCNYVLFIVIIIIILILLVVILHVLLLVFKFIISIIILLLNMVLYISLQLQQILHLRQAIASSK